MFALPIYVMALCVTVGVSGLSAISDLRRLSIPNVYALILFFAFWAAYALLWGLGAAHIVFMPLMSHILSGLIVFGLTSALFAFGLMGAGDSKMASALALWTGLPGLIIFLFFTGLAGGVLALWALFVQKKKPFKNPDPGGWIGNLQAGNSKVAYGIAIFAGALTAFADLGYFNLQTLLALAQV